MKFVLLPRILTIILVVVQTLALAAQVNITMQLVAALLNVVMVHQIEQQVADVMHSAQAELLIIIQQVADVLHNVQVVHQIEPRTVVVQQIVAQQHEIKVV